MPQQQQQQSGVNYRAATKVAAKNLQVFEDEEFVNNYIDAYLTEQHINHFVHF